MEEPSPRSSRLVLAGALAATIAVGGAGFLLGRLGTERAQGVAGPPISAPAPPRAPEPPPVRGMLGRADLIALAAAAADAAAAGREPGPELAQADGRRFELRLPFGCDGAADEDSNAAMRWRYDAEEGVLRIHVASVTWAPQDWWSGAATGVETVEGFWIARPWTSSESCPVRGDRAAAPGAEPVTLPGQTLALGQIFFAEGARGGRRKGEPYETAVRLPQSALKAAEGFRVRVSGRIARTRGLGPVLCRQPAGPEQRPICLVSVVLDEVAIENPARNETLATWSLDGSQTSGA